MLRHPFLAAAVARLPLTDAADSPWCATAATDGYHIVVNSQFLADLSDDEAEFVLAHELLHCVLGHADRRGERLPEVWNVATDYAANQLLVDAGFTMPKAGLFNESSRGQSAEAIYDRLMDRANTSGMPQGHDPIRGNAGLGTAGAALERVMTADQLRRLVARGGWCIQLDPDGQEGGELRGSDMPSELERRRMREGLATSLRSMLHGRVAAMAEEEITAGSRSSITWADLLARFVTGIRQTDYRSYPFNKKHLHRGVYLPSTGAPGPQRLVVAIDTSGSVDAAIASRMLAEVDGLRAATECRLTLIQCDAEVQSVTDFDAWDAAILEDPARTFTLRGRGGTDFRPVFDWLAVDAGTADLAADAVIYLTDGYGSFPEKEPPWPVVWVLTADGLAETMIPFGSVIRLPRGREFDQ